MKTTPFTTAVEEVIKSDMDISDEIIEEEIESIADVGSPEKLIGKKYETWTPQDLQRLAQIYGPGDDSPLGKLIFSKEYGKVLELEKEA